MDNNQNDNTFFNNDSNINNSGPVSQPNSNLNPMDIFMNQPNADGSMNVETNQVSQTINNNSSINTMPTIEPEPVEQKEFITPQEPIQNSINSNIEDNNLNQMNNTIMTNPQPMNNNYIDDEELLQAFVGANYEKISKKGFNFAGFFFTSFYMFYRKMFLYGLIVFILNLIVLNVIKVSWITMLFNIAVGLFVNTVYMSFASEKINKIKQDNNQKSSADIKSICINKGGTSVVQLFIGFVVELVIAILVVIVMTIIGIGSFIGDFFNFSININSGTLLEDANITGYVCTGSTDCYISIEPLNEEDAEIKYIYKDYDTIDFFSSLSDYDKYIKVNIYYTQKNQERIINKYEIFSKSTNENISDVKTIDELRKKLGLYTLGVHTDTLTLTKIGTTGVGFDNNNSYTYIDYTFVDGKNNEYEMKYKIPMGSKPLNLIQGNKYTVTFDVVDKDFGFDEYNIKSIK